MRGKRHRDYLEAIVLRPTKREKPWVHCITRISEVNCLQIEKALVGEAIAVLSVALLADAGVPPGYSPSRVFNIHYRYLLLCELQRVL